MSTDQPARVIADRFEVVRLLGEGASAKTLLCRDREEDREVAIKELHIAHQDDWKRIELFQREAKTLAGLRHHAVPQVFESIEREDDGVLILVQEFVEGGSLAQRMAQGPSLGQVELMQLTVGVLDVLEYLHGRSPPVYHRDIKPSNIIVRPSGAPVLVDFGSVTHGWRPPAAAGSTVTGTFGYMPPEQLMGQVGPTSDLYALGATLLHVLTGRPPTDFPFDSGRIEVPEDLPAPTALRQLVVALLEPAPNRRPANVKVARAILHGQPIEAAQASTAMVSISDRPLSLAISSGPVVIVGGEGPKYVDVGPAPRDPDGPHQRTYRLLIEPLNLIHRAQSSAGQIARTVGVSILFVVTIGLYPLLFYTDRAKRRRRYSEVFQRGTRTHGTISDIIRAKSVQGEIDIYATIRYEFMAGTAKCRADIRYPVPMTKPLAIGDRVAVLYLDDDPARSCVVFRQTDWA